MRMMRIWRFGTSLDGVGGYLVNRGGRIGWVRRGKKGGKNVGLRVDFVSKTSSGYVSPFPSPYSTTTDVIMM